MHGFQGYEADTAIFVGWHFHLSTHRNQIRNSTSLSFSPPTLILRRTKEKEWKALKKLTHRSLLSLLARGKVRPSNKMSDLSTNVR